MDLIHIILSHHGELEYGSPKVPSTPEALVVHYADDLDAKMDMVRTASTDPDVTEAFVRGLRRSFLFGGEQSISPEFEKRQTKPPAASDGEKDDQGDLFWRRQTKESVEDEVEDLDLVLVEV